MKKTILIIAAILMAFGIQATARSASEVLSGIIPAPESVVEGEGYFKVKGASVRCDKYFDEKTQKAVEEFASSLSMVCGGKCQYKSGKASSKGINFIPNTELGPEAYKICISNKSVLVAASARAGVLYAIQTLKQMLPVAVYGNVPAEGEDWTLPSCTINDAPRYAYRSMLLDCGRHFYTLEDIKRYLNIMAVYKMNVFHWHLTEDQGWRIEIKKYPRLTEVGAWRSGTQIGKDRSSSDGISHGGFYTQDQIRELIAYADKLGIEIVPEVDMPGHMLAALASYPEYGCEGSQPQPYKVWTRWGVCPQVINFGKSETIKFLEDIICEVADLFPSEYFCIGGDECPKGEWKNDPYCQAKIRELGLVGDEKSSAENRLQNYYMSYFQKVLAAKGKKVLGADELMDGDLDEAGIIIQAWRGTRRGIAAAEKGFDVLMHPTTYCYLDYYQLKDTDTQPLAIGNYLPLSKVYSFEPEKGFPADAVSHIIGVQAQMWTEYIATPEHLEYMMFPRFFALSEAQWTKPGNKNYERFLGSVNNHQKKILDLLGYNYCKTYE